MAQYNVILVAGHALGGDPGAVYQNFKEAEEVAKIVDKAAAILAPHPTVAVDVVPHNLDMVDSVTWINKRYQWDGSDTIAVDVHLNSHTSKAHGVETWVGDRSYPEGARLGQTIQNAMVESTGLINRGVKETAWYVIRECNPLGVLVECRFINGDENSDAANEKAAWGLANGLCDYFRQPRPTKNTPAPTPKPTPVIEPKQLYHVMLNGKQLGAYAVDKNAYTKWKDNPGSVILDGTGKDVTGVLVERYGEKVVVPTPIAPVEPIDYQETKKRITALEGIVNAIVEFLTNMFKGFKK